jgi:hypothetical protein
VYDFGQVHENYISILKAHWRWVWKIRNDDDDDDETSEDGEENDSGIDEDFRGGKARRRIRELDKQGRHKNSSKGLEKPRTRRVKEEHMPNLSDKFGALVIKDTRHATASWRYSPNADMIVRAIELCEGDVITNIVAVSEGWAQGTNARSGKTGLFPSNYV